MSQGQATPSAIPQANPPASRRGLFVGLITLDCLYRVEQVPGSDDKIVAQDCLLLAGGPATNAAIAFQALGNSATLMGALGQHPVTSLIGADLAAQGVTLWDLTAQRPEPPPFSTILVTAASGERAVISRNAVSCQAPPESVDETALAQVLVDVDLVLIDGHQMAVSLKVAQVARQRQIPVIVDGGSWKAGFEALLPLATSVIASARFFPPKCQSSADTLAYLAALGISEIAITQGQEPILYRHRGETQLLPVPAVAVQDTLGAGDIFHGAFCHYRQPAGWPQALSAASEIAAQSCRYFGPRAWIAAAKTA